VKVELISNNLELAIDLSEYPKDVSDYVFDQIEDEVCEHFEYEIERDYTNQKLIITCYITEHIQRIIEEKLHDMEYERRHEQN